MLKTVLNHNKGYDLTSCENFSLERIVFKKTFVAFFFFFFLIKGIFVSFLLAILYPENRLTLSQFTATFHGIGAIIVAFYLDPMLSRSIDLVDNKDAWINNVYSIILGRVLSYLMILLAVSFFLIFRTL